MSAYLERQGSSRLGTTQKVATSTTSAATGAFGSETFQLRIVVDVDSFITIGDGTPTATTSSAFLPAKWPEYFTCTPGQKAAAILGTGTGNMYVTEIA